jgi:hypothetical protein
MQTAIALHPQADPIARHLLEEDIPELERALKLGWDVNKPIKATYDWGQRPVNLALSHHKEKLLDYLLASGVELNFALFNPVICAICEGCPASTLEKLIAHGARIDATNQVGWGAFQAAISAKRFDLLPLLLRLGLPIPADGGNALRSAVFERQLAAVQFLVEHGYDINQCGPDAVFSGNPSAVALAARNGDLETVRYLVEHGADLTIIDDYGHRAYSYAAKSGNDELLQFIKSQEPVEWHTCEHHTRRIAEYGPPAGLVEILKQPSRRIDLTIGGHHPKFIEFHPLERVIELNWKGRKLLDLLAIVDDYWETGYLVWAPHHRKIGHADYEHGKLTILCTWENFIADPSKWIAKLPT